MKNWEAAVRELDSTAFDGDATTEPASSDAADNDLAISVEESGQGLEPVSATILITIAAKLTEHALSKLWDDILWPRLRRRFGANAVGEEKKAS